MGMKKKERSREKQKKKKKQKCKTDPLTFNSCHFSLLTFSFVISVL